MQFPMVKTRRERLWKRPAVLALSVALSAGSAMQAHALSALSEIPGSTSSQTPPEKDAKPSQPGNGLPGVGLPDPLIGDKTGQQEQSGDTPKPLNGGKPATAIYDISTVPEPVRHMRQLLVEAAASGDIERLRPLLGTGATATEISVGDTAGDPVNTLKEQAGDPDGIEILSSLLNIMSTGFVHVSPGTPDEAYVWPYFAAKPLNTLTAPEKVELMRIVTAGDYADMVDFGTYSYFRVGISPDGKWKFLRSGE